MSDAELATETSSSSQLETVQPFTIEESPALEVGFESPKVLDSSTLICTSIGKSPLQLSSTFKSTEPRHSRVRSWALTNRLSHNQDATNSFPDSIEGSSSDDGDGRSISSSGSRSEPTVTTDGDDGDNAMAQDDDFATNHSAKSTASEPVTNGGSTERTNTNSNFEDGTDSESLENTQAVEPQEEEESVTESENFGHPSSTEAGGSGVQSSESSATGEHSDSVFANLAEAASPETTERPAAGGRTSLRVNKAELANLIEKAILDFCSSRTVETMRRMFAGVTNDTETLLRDGGRHDDKSASTPHPVTGELVKEGIIIGDIDVFAPRMQREYILPMRDSNIEVFLKEPGVFRAICHKTRCQVEVTRRLLNRKLCLGGHWHKYMIIRIVGPTYRTITNCDVLLQKAVPSYKSRKVYTVPAHCRLFLREDVPDNAELYNSFQRTGGTAQRFGYLKLESPYRSTPLRNIGICPWKFGLFKPGKLAFSMPASRMCMKHVYPSLGYQTTSNLEKEYQGVNASERIHNLYEMFQMKRQNALTLKRTLTIPVCR